MTTEELREAKIRVYDLAIQRDALHAELNKISEPYSLKIQKINMELDALNKEIAVASKAK